MKSYLILIATFYTLIFASNDLCAKAALPATTLTDIETFSKKSLNEKTDLEEVKEKLKILLILEDEDPSRTAVLMLSESYNKHSALYEKAIKTVENKKNKKQLNEIRGIFKSFYKKGNG